MKAGHVRGQQGSILLVLLASLVIGGVVVVLFASTLMGQRQVRSDRSFTNAIHAGDTGVQAALTRINNLEAEEFVAPGSAEATFDSGGPLPLEDRLAFEYTATKVSKSRWEIVSFGTSTDAEGDQRKIEAVIEAAPLIEFAAFAKTLGDFGGGNTADSYDYQTGATDTGRGLIGSNGTVVIDNSATATGVDGVELHDFFDDPDDPTDDDQDDIPTRVQLGCATAECQRFHELEEEGGKISGLFEKPLVVDDWWIAASLGSAEDRNPASPYVKNSDARAECNSTLTGLAGTVPGSLTFNSDGSVLADGGQVEPVSSPAFIEPGVYCAGSGGVSFKTVSSHPKTFSVDSTTMDDGVVQDPVIIYTSGPVAIDPQVSLACNTDDLMVDGAGTLTAGCPTPVAQRFQLYSNVQAASTSSTEVAIGNQTNVVGLIYAPSANCGASPSNASADLYGAVLCGALNNLGGWAFHFDEHVTEIAKQEYIVTEWREEIGGTSSF